MTSTPTLEENEGYLVATKHHVGVNFHAFRSYTALFTSYQALSTDASLYKASS